jgi:hypothetical protein
MEDKFSELIKAASAQARADEQQRVSPEFERRVMVAVARRAIERVRRRARFNLVASLSGVGIAAAACVAAVVVWFPTQVVLSVDFNAVFDNVVASIKALLP